MHISLLDVFVALLFFATRVNGIPRRPDTVDIYLGVGNPEPISTDGRPQIVEKCPNQPAGVCCRKVINRPSVRGDQVISTTFDGLKPTMHIATWVSMAGTSAEDYGCSGHLTSTIYMALLPKKSRFLKTMMYPLPVTGGMWIDRARHRESYLDLMLGHNEVLLQAARKAFWPDFLRPQQRKRDGARQQTFPSIIIFNETEYSDEERGDLKYRDAAGNLLDLEAASRL
ncbi:MAG: hypothetical protein M1833_001224 [Piccolia ochrophora]|nr:MAG: hypothetical protein M1833_001224 [Piccolia ochrophora]